MTQVRSVHPKLLLHLLTPRRRSQATAGFSLVMGILVLLALVTGTLALSSVSSGSLFGSVQTNENREARAAAEAGINQIIATWNMPENRKMLVSGTAMNSWAGASGTTLQSPCIKTDGTGDRPGTAKDGQATSTARSFGDGAARDVVTLATNTGERRFALQSVTFGAGSNTVTNGDPNRRSVRTTTTAGSSTLTKVNASTKGFDQLINLDDPDGNGLRLRGYNTGFLTLTVQGQVVRGGQTVATAVVTREFEVLPKCCGTSFGSNGSGGENLTSTTANSATISNGTTDINTTVRNASIGADSRYCGVDFGVITGLGGGTHWTFYANDSYTVRDTSGNVVPLTNIIGDTTGQSGANLTTFDRSNCRVIPCKNSTGTDGTYWSQINSATLNTGGTSGLITGFSNTPPATTAQQTANKAGTMISSIPVIPATLNLPPVTNFTFTFSGAAATSTREAFNTTAGVTLSNSLNQICSNTTTGCVAEYLRTNRTTQAVERRYATSTAALADCKDFNGNVTCPTSGGFAWGKVDSCQYTSSSPVTAAEGFHCKGFLIDYTGTGAQSMVIDTSDGPITWYYNSVSGWSYVNNLVDIILLGTGDSIQHVECSPPSLQTSCATPIPDTTFAPLGVPDRWNIFGAPDNASFPNFRQHIYLNATSSGSTDPGKITGVWFYLPTGFLELNASLGGSCVATNVDCYNVNGRIWVKDLKAFGDLVFRVPPSSGANFIAGSTAGSIRVVPWFGTDWIARAVSNVRNY